MFLFRRKGLTTSRLADAVRGGPASLDLDVLAARLLLRSRPAPEKTLYREVSATVSLERDHFDPDAEVARTVQEAVAALKHALARAVDRALEGCKRVAVMAGGGTDSAALLALAVDWAQRSGGSAFGVALDFASVGDDRPHLASMESWLGCEIVRVRPEDAALHFALVERGVDDAPFTWPGGALEVLLLERARTNGADRVLSGVGADALLDGEPRALAALLRRGHVREAVRAVVALRGFDRPRSPVLSWLFRPLVSSAVPARARRLRECLRPLDSPAWAGPELRSRLYEWTAAARERAPRLINDGAERFDALRGEEQLEHLLWLRHQEQVAAQIERIDPYLDSEVVASVIALPQDWLLFGGTRRGLFREAMRGLLPESVRLRLDKAAFEPAFARFFEAARGRDSLAPLANLECLADLGFVQPKKFADDFAHFVAAPETADGWETVWPALAVESFLRSRATRCS